MYSEWLTHTFNYVRVFRAGVSFRHPHLETTTKIHGLPNLYRVLGKTKQQRQQLRDDDDDDNDDVATKTTSW